MMKVNVGDTISFQNEFGERKSGEILQVLSDVSSYENMKLKDGIAYYWSKKMSKYVPVKKKNIDSVFLELETFFGRAFIWMNEIERIIKPL